MKINSTFTAAKWADSMKIWEKNTSSLEEIILGVYKSIPSFNTHYNYFRKSPSKNELDKYIKLNTDSILAFTFLLQSDHYFYDQYFDAYIFSSILESSSTLDERAYKMLFSALISNYTNDINLYDLSLDELYKESIKRFNKLFEPLEKCGLLSKYPITNFKEFCKKKNTTPIETIRKLNITIAPNSKLVREVTKSLIIDEINSTDFSFFSELSEKIVKQNMFNWEEDGTELFGHTIIRSVLNKFSKVDIHESWVNLILNQASDPRTAKNSKLYLKWWSRIDDKLISRFVQVISHGDILIFLNALSDFAKHGDKEMARMFDSRKRLLVGLSLQNLIDESRLFLPLSVIEYLKKERPGLNLDFVGILNGSYGKSLIYLKAGDTHIIEGSHNCKIRMYKDKLVREDLLDSKIKQWEYDQLTVGMEKRHYIKFLEEPFAKAHDKNGKWKIQAITFLKKSLEFKPEQLMTEKEISSFRYG